MKQAYLKRTSSELSIIGGIGAFAAHLPAVPVPDSIGYQYDTDDMRAAGWLVTWVDMSPPMLQADTHTTPNDADE